MATQTELEQILSLASEQELGFLALNGYNYAENNPDMSEEEQCGLLYVMSMVAAEVERRKIEPLWRKARRFAMRNSDILKQVGKVAACIGIGAVLGISLDS